MASIARQEMVKQMSHDEKLQCQIAGENYDSDSNDDNNVEE